MLPGLANTCPRSTSSRFVPRSSTPTLSPACPSSSSLRNISTPVQMVFCVAFSPTISTSSFTLTIPRSMRPVTTVPRPEIENTSSTGIKNGFSTSRLGIGMYLSIFATNLALVPFQRLQRRPDHNRGLIPGELVHRQQLPDLHFHQLQQLLVVHHVRFVHEHHDVW